MYKEDMIKDFSSYNSFAGPRVIYVTMAGCPHCVEFTPMVEDAAYRVPVPIFKANDMHHDVIRAQFGQYVNGFPTLLFIDENGVVSVFNHYRSPQNVADWISIEMSRQVGDPDSFIV